MHKGFKSAQTTRSLVAMIKEGSCGSSNNKTTIAQHTYEASIWIG